jgi:hypothetical protein
MDAVRILMANGPTGGNLDDVKETNMISPTTTCGGGFLCHLAVVMTPDDIRYIASGPAWGWYHRP